MASILEVIPSEIICAIVDTIALGDKEERRKNRDLVPFSTLKACSLTCRAFVPLYRRHAFKHIVLKSHRDRVVLPSHVSLHLATASSFIKLITNSPEIALFVQEMTLNFKTTHHEDQYDHPSAVPSVLQRLTRLKSVAFVGHRRYYDWQSMPPFLRNFVHNLTLLQSITSLTMTTIKNFTLSTLVSFSSLKTLKLVDVNMAETDQLAATSLAENIQLTGLITQRCGEQLYGKFLHQKRSDKKPIISFEKFETLVVYIMDAEDVPGAQYLFNGLPHVLNITLSINETMKGPINARGLVASMSPCLKTLKTLDILLAVPGDPLSGICAPLQAMTNENSIEVLRLYVGCIETVGYEWDALEQALLSPGWSYLKRVFLIAKLSRGFSGSTLNEPLRDQLNTKLHRLSATNSFIFTPIFLD